MKRSLDLTADQRVRLLDLYRGAPDAEIRFRSHILLLLGDGHTWVSVATLLYCSSRTIDRRVKRFHIEGVEGVRQGKVFDIEVAATDSAAAEATLRTACEKLLANTVVENYRIERA